jgi:hypothetical protein
MGHWLSMCYGSLVIGVLLVIGHWSLVICHSSSYRILSFMSVVPEYSCISRKGA